MARGAAADEQPLPHQLLDVLQTGCTDPHALKCDIDLAHVVAVERGDRARQVVSACAREVEVGGPQAVERGLGEVRCGLARDERDDGFCLDR